jgi:hypothetical protein
MKKPRLLQIGTDAAYTFRFGTSAVAIGPTTAARISIPPTMIAPERLAQIKIARIGCRTDSRASHSADRSTRDGIAGRCADGSAARRADHAAAEGAVARAITASCDGQQGGKSQHKHIGAHLRAPLSVT